MAGASGVGNHIRQPQGTFSDLKGAETHDKYVAKDIWTNRNQGTV